MPWNNGQTGYVPSRQPRPLRPEPAPRLIPAAAVKVQAVAAAAIAATPAESLPMPNRAAEHAAAYAEANALLGIRSATERFAAKVQRRLEREAKARLREARRARKAAAMLALPAERPVKPYRSKASRKARTVTAELAQALAYVNTWSSR